MFGSPWLCLAVVVSALLLTPARTPAGAPELVASWDASRCRVDLEVDREDGVLRLRSRCPLSEEEAPKALSETLPRLRDFGDSPGRYRSLFLGRLVDYPWLSEGLARWAARSSGWDNRKGLSRGERNSNAFVERALRDAGILRSLADALAREGLRVTGVSAEKVLIAPVAQLPFGGRLRTEGVAGSARVPYDAMVHLVLGPGAGSH
ncbi:MAG: hypothetical protein HZB55_24325 [Deltaproteobacteria bacterium]|nr:hypothetical protein [Deltaproteobacteria bacterium]